VAEVADRPEDRVSGLFRSVHQPLFLSDAAVHSTRRRGHRWDCASIIALVRKREV
jgi:hypothetical protein